MLAIGTDATRDRIAELRKRPGPDAGLLIRRDVGNMKRAEGTLERHAARQYQSLVAFGLRRLMTADTASHGEDEFAVLDVGRTS